MSNVQEFFSNNVVLDLHLGFHKTATTYIQRMFDENAKQLHQQGLFSPKQWRFREQYAQTKNLDLVLTTLLSDKWENNLKRILISDENLPGTMATIFSGFGFYPRCKERLEVFRSASTLTPRRIFISVRNYADFFPSAYVQWINTTDFIPLGPKVVRRVGQLERGWLECIEEIAEVFPESELIIWPYEIFKLNNGPILEMMLGIPSENLKQPKLDHVNASLSWEAYQVFELAINLGYKNDELRPFLKKNPFPKGTPIGQVFWKEHQEEYERQIARYERDLERIDQKFGITLFSETVEFD